MQRRNLLLLLSIFLPFFIFATTKNIPEKILFTVTFNQMTKVNEKFLMKQQSDLEQKNEVVNEKNEESEVIETENTEEKAEDLDNSSDVNQDISVENEDVAENEGVTEGEEEDICLSEEQRDFYQNVLEKNKADLEMKLFNFIKSKNITTAFFRSLENPENVPEINIFVENYQSGEFNLIKNINTKMTYVVEIKDRNKKNVAKIKKKYIVKTVSSMPLEAQRLSELNQRFVKDLFRLMTRYLQEKIQ